MSSRMNRNATINNAETRAIYRTRNVIWVSLFIAISALIAYLVLSALWQNLGKLNVP